jgi:hypothetical protein
MIIYRNTRGERIDQLFRSQLVERLFIKYAYAAAFKVPPITQVFHKQNSSDCEKIKTTETECLKNAEGHCSGVRHVAWDLE